MYKIIRPLLFCFPPETAHSLALNLLNILYKLRLMRLLNACLPRQPMQAFGLTFKNPVGIAAGLDKNGDYLDALAALGVGFIEVGAVTPLPQAGNPKPHLFRLIKAEALINRMGFNNKGVDYLVQNLQRRKSSCIVGVNLGKNKDTPLKDAASDYISSLEKIFPYSDFATINISSPNTPDLRKLQTPEYLQELLIAIKKARDWQSARLQKQLPLLVKIAPDLDDAELSHLIDIIIRVGLEGVIITNTSNQRYGLQQPLAKESGGLSGKPLAKLSYDMLIKVRQRSATLAIISVGGIDSVSEAKRRWDAGANLLQVYTGLIFQGPKLIRQLTRFIYNATYQRNDQTN